MMGFWQPVTNLKEYASHNPPGVTFLLCLFALSVSFIYFSSYSHTHTLPNPDIAKDWNHLLSSLSQLQLCETKTTSLSEPNASVSSPMIKLDKDQKNLINQTKNPLSVTQLHLRVPLSITVGSQSVSLTDLSLHATLKASQLKVGDEESINMTLDAFSGNNTHSCLYIRAPTNLLPMSLLPPKCPVSEKVIPTIPVEVSDEDPSVSQTCYTLHSEFDPKLTVMLTKEEQGLTERHLLEVGVCLLVICTLLCLTTSLMPSFSRRRNWNGLDSQNEPLIEI